MSNESHVYVAGASRDGPLKIGVTMNLTRRLGELQTGNPQRLKMFWSVAVPFMQARTAEATIHTALAHGRMAGEWFAMPIEAAVEAILRTTETLAELDKPRPQAVHVDQGCEVIWLASPSKGELIYDPPRVQWRTTWEAPFWKDRA